jgi:hypothetical protein
VLCFDTMVFIYGEERRGEERRLVIEEINNFNVFL